MIGRFQEAILILLLGCKEEMTTNQIQDALSNKLYKVGLGALYNSLDRLVRDDLITREKGKPTSVRGGKAPNIYVITSAGRQLLADIKADREKLEGEFAAFRPQSSRKRRGEEPKY